MQTRRSQSLRHQKPPTLLTWVFILGFAISRKFTLFKTISLYLQLFKFKKKIFKDSLEQVALIYHILRKILNPNFLSENLNFLPPF